MCLEVENDVRKESQIRERDFRNFSSGREDDKYMNILEGSSIKKSISISHLLKGN